MIPAHLKLARRLEARLHELAPDVKTDAELVEALLPHILGEFAGAVGERRLLHLVARELVQMEERAKKASTAAAAAEAARPCFKFFACGRNATAERFDPAGTGKWLPACPDHLKDALPMELRPLAPR